MFEVVFILKKGPEMAYVVEAKDAFEARQKANYHFLIEAGGAKVKKVRIKSLIKK